MSDEETFTPTLAQLQELRENPDITEHNVKVVWWILNRFSQSGIQEAQFLALLDLENEVNRFVNEMTDSEKATRRFNYEFFNERLADLAKITPDDEGRFYFEIPSLENKQQIRQHKINLTSLSVRELVSVAVQFKQTIMDELFSHLRPTFFAYLDEQTLAEQKRIVDLLHTSEKLRAIDWPASETLKEIVNSRSLSTMSLTDGSRGCAMVRALTGLSFSDEQLQTLQSIVPELMDCFEAVPRTKHDNSVYSITILSRFIAGLGELRVENDKHAVVSFDGLSVPVNIIAEGQRTVHTMMARQILDAATLVRRAFNEQVAAQIIPYIEVKLPELVEKEKHEAQVQEQQKQLKQQQKIRDALGDDAAFIRIKETSGSCGLFDKRHPEFVINYAAESRDHFINKLGSIYPAFKRKVNAYAMQLYEGQRKYGLKWEIKKDDTIIATLPDLDINLSLKNANPEKPKALNRCDGDDILSWMRTVIRQVEIRQSKRLAKLYALQNKGLEVELGIKDDPSATKIIRLLQNGSEVAQAELIGSEGLIGTEAMRLIKQAESMVQKKPVIQNTSEPEEPTKHQAAVKKTELVIDNVSLSILANPRMKKPGCNDTFLPVIQMAEMIPETERVAIPSIVADFEARAMMPAVDERGEHQLLFLDESPHKKAQPIDTLLAKAQRIRIHEDGTEEILKAGDPKLVIFESAKQDLFYEQVRQWKQQAEACGISIASQLPFLREEIGKNQGEDAIYDYCMRYSKHRPVIVTDDYNSIYRRQFLATHGDSENKLYTPDGVGIGFSTTRGLVGAVKLAYEDLALPFFNKLGKKDHAIKDVSVTGISQLLKQSASKIDQELFDSEFPDYIAGQGKASRHEAQLHNRFVSRGRKFLINEGYTSPQLFTNGWQSFVKKYPFLETNASRGVS